MRSLIPLRFAVKPALLALAIAGLVSYGGSGDNDTPAPQPNPPAEPFDFSVVGGAHGYVDGPATQALFG